VTPARVVVAASIVQHRQRALALVRRAKAGASRDKRDLGRTKTNAWKTGGGGLWQTGSYDPGHQAHHLGVPAIPIRSTIPTRGRAAKTLHQSRQSRSTFNTGKLAWHFPVHSERLWD